MGTDMPVSVRLRNAGIALLLGVCTWWYGNPIGLHQKVQMAGVGVPVPFGWVLHTTASQADPIDYVDLRRAFIPFRPWIAVSIAREMPGGPYTIDSARLQQATMYQDAAYYSHLRTFDLSSGKYHSLCAEATMRGGAQILTCAVLGTPLSFNFMGSKAVDGDAERLLASLT
jgi:hypothetical protein